MILMEMMQDLMTVRETWCRKKWELFKKQLDMLQLQFIELIHEAKSQQGESNSDNVLKQSDNNNNFKCLLWKEEACYLQF